MEHKYKTLKQISSEKEYIEIKKHLEALINIATEKGYLSNTEIPNEYTTEIGRLGGICVDYENEVKRFDFDKYAPSEIILHEMKQKSITQKELAEMLELSASYINEILKGKKNITANLAVRLENVLDLPAEFWLKIQMQYEISKARKDKSNQQQKANFSKRFRAGNGNKIEKV